MTCSLFFGCNGSWFKMLIYLLKSVINSFLTCSVLISNENDLPRYVNDSPISTGGIISLLRIMYGVN